MNTCEWDIYHAPLISDFKSIAASAMLHLSDTVDDSNVDNRSS